MAAENLRTWKIGDVEVTRIVEVNGHTDPLEVLLEQGSAELMKRHDWLFPHFATPEGDMRISFQCFVVKTPQHSMMIDTCIGSDRRRHFDIFTDMQSDFLDDLKQAGFTREDIDTVLCTHLHFDHVGWNTMKVDGQWVPTFPNASYLFGKKEWEYWLTVPRDGDIEAEHLVDAVDPVFEAGLVRLIDSDHRLGDEIRLFPTPGHTPGHVSVHISSQGEEAVITGDLMHHPVQMAVPDMPANFDMDKSQACATRRQFCEDYQGRRAFVIGSHFCEPGAGWIVRDEDHWRFETD